ncbi:MAG: hypothetical protein OEW62_00475 [Candidatus Bathyarchaeota archaeon]|nr:hypothetical protein [Candidatus Bathyarchaeota archaeon]MDH5745531.1 hypothetical protein [Candidatus Bathyarchaeota archaeon]
MMKRLLNQQRVPLSIATLARVKAWAVRRRVWYRALSRSERGQMDLTIRIVKRVHNSLLARVLRSILKKLFEAGESKVSRLMREVGESLAKRLSAIAKGWGCRSADAWAEDTGFIRFLTVNYMNMPALHRV